MYHHRSVGVDRRKNLESFVFQAFVSLGVNAFGAGVLAVLYYNAFVLKPYLLALFWATVCSIPLFQLKVYCIELCRLRLGYLCGASYQILAVDDFGMLDLKPWSSSSRSFRGEPVEKRGDLRLPADLMGSLHLRELQQHLRDGHSMEAVVSALPGHAAEIISLLPKVDAKGCSSLLSGPAADMLFRDVSAARRACLFLKTWLSAPLVEFRSEVSNAGPYFGVLFRCGLLRLLWNFFACDFAMTAFIFATHLYAALWLCRCAFALQKVAANRVLRLRLTRWLNKRCRPLAALSALRALGSWGSAAEKLRVLLQDALGGALWAFSEWFLARADALMALFVLSASIVGVAQLVAVVTVALTEETFAIGRAIETEMSPRLTELFESTAEMRSAIPSDSSGAQIYDFFRAAADAVVPQTRSDGDLRPPAQNLSVLLQEVVGQQVGAAGFLAWVLAGADPFFGVGAAHGPPREAGLPGVDNRSGAGGAEVCIEAVDPAASAHLASPQCADAAILASPWPSLSTFDPRFVSAARFVEHLRRGNLSVAMDSGALVYAELVEMWTCAVGLFGESSHWALNGSARFAGVAARAVVSSLGSSFVFASSMFGQAVVFLTALYYLVASEISCLEVLGDVLMVVDRGGAIHRITELVIRAVLLSALKMSVFHALFTWLLFSWAEIPLVAIPTVISALLALLPVVSPVWSVSMWAVVYLAVRGQQVSALLAFVMNLAVWWKVPAVIYAEIPGANPWLTGLSAVLGIRQLGAIGVVFGPVAVSVPVICLNLLRMCNEKRREEAESSATPALARSERFCTSKSSLLNLYEVPLETQS